MLAIHVNSIPLTEFVSALGGAVAALCLRGAIRLLGNVWSRFRPLATYSCAGAAVPQRADLTGILLHGRGKRVVDRRALHGIAWAHTPDATSAGHPHTVFGPYVNDFPRPGFYIVRFRVYGEGYARGDNTPVVILDVLQRPEFLNDERLVVLGQHVVTAEALSRGRYGWFEVYCYASASGNHEYRCLVIPEAVKEHHTLRFDTISVHSYVPLREVF
jgi:hypothetical protein